ncbi:hypothetical protein LTSEINV_0855 [Salmonella enterica subsp. enterica serovar Inverness str. R8-3668]|uniref:Uncharacterized protein n=1 Tax=Salmonella enterica subsp. enterica serovar Inverness str. R8-3668 TaxID=913075 RepID=G5N924_SALET|nr:hypothetical protein LTSEINV_0855 [Salmonella enterica subsp. enterica serovar Inverness str. R8-3668]
MVRDIQNFKNFGVDIQNFKNFILFGGELHGSPVAFGPHHDGDTRRIIAGRHAS